MLRRRVRLAIVLGALTWLAAPAPAYAWIGGLAKLARVARGAKAAAKLVKLGKIAKITPAAKAAILAGGSAIAAERAAIAFATLPADAARAARYVAREPDGLFRVVTRSGEPSTHALADLGRATHATSAERLTSDVVLDLTAAQAANDLPPLPPGGRYFVMDAEGKTHAVSSVQREGHASWIVDVGGEAVDLADFATASLDGADGSIPDWLYVVFGAGAYGVLWLFWRRERARRAAM